MAKLRVYELAKELGVESKELLAHLKEQGEFVRSASSTIEPPVVRKIRENPPAAAAKGGKGEEKAALRARFDALKARHEGDDGTGGISRIERELDAFGVGLRR